MCNAILALPTFWSYGQSPAYQNCEFGANLKGYSVERADATPNSGYVMAGTVLIPTQNVVHYVATDDQGTISASNIFRGNGLDLKAVDIVPGDNGNGTYYITTQVRRVSNGGFANAYLRVYEVDLAGNPVNIWDVFPQPAQAPFQTDMFASHSVLRNGLLYICGWTEIVSSYPYNPTASSGAKRGMVVCLNVNNSGAYVDGTSWNSQSSVPSPTLDFDIALKMRLEPNQSQLLVTGAANGSTNAGTPSNVMIAALDLTTLNPVWHRRFTQTGATTGDNRYGLDAWFGSAGETYVMFNQEQGGSYRWGISVVRPNGTLPTSLPNLHTFGGLNFWSNQAFFSGGSQHQIKVVGQQISNDPSCVPVPVPSAPFNVNPFLTDITCTYKPANSLLVTTLGGHTVETSLATTQPAGADYFTANGFLSDVSRFFTFAAGEDPSLGISDYVLISPTRSPGPPPVTGPTVLNFKFNRVDNSGNQPLCPMSFHDCPTGPVQDLLFEGQGPAGFEPIVVDVQPANNSSNAPFAFSQNPCAVYYRDAAGPGATPASPLHIQSAASASLESAQAHFSASVETGAVVDLRIYNMQGQQVAKIAGVGAGSTDIRLALPGLAPGLYAMSASVNGTATGVVRLTVQ